MIDLQSCRYLETAGGDAPITYHVAVGSQIEADGTNDRMTQRLTRPSLDTFCIGNRRYLGSKSKLLSCIENGVLRRLGRAPLTLIDAFAGSGVVGARFAELGSRVVMNDLLAHNALAHQTFLLHKNYSPKSLHGHLCAMSELPPIEGYIYTTFGGNYFSKENAMRLDAWREYISQENLDQPTSAALTTSVIYAADKVAQTVGHYDAFFASSKVNRPAELRYPMPVGTGSGHEVFNVDANKLIENQEAEVLYLDPPYNSRQYADNYHVLENIVRWEKPQVFGVARKMDRTGLKSRFSGRKAEEAFEELILTARAEMIVLSYSNTGTSRVSRSNNLLSDEFIIDVMKRRGRLSIDEFDFKEFSVGRTSGRDHRERLFICEVDK